MHRLYHCHADEVVKVRGELIAPELLDKRIEQSDSSIVYQPGVLYRPSSVPDAFPPPARDSTMQVWQAGQEAVACGGHKL